VSSTSLPCLPPADALPDGAFPPVGRLGLTSPPSPVRCAATTATLPVSGSFTCRSFPDTLPASVVHGVPDGLVARMEAPRPRQGLWSPGPPLRELSSRRQVALPRSRVPPVKTCPALRPRWCPAHSPSRTQDCCLPALANRRLSPLYHLEGYPPVHDYTPFGAQSRGLPSRCPRLRMAPCGEARGFATDLLARR